jgi:PAS domain-containing protein
VDVVPLIDAVAVLGFSAAAVVLATTPSAQNQRFNPMAKTFSIASFLVYVFSLGVGLLLAPAEGSVLEQLEDFVEVLFPIFTLMAVSFDYSGQQAADMLRSQRAMRASHDMMIGIVDAAPSGILLVESSGEISFANEVASDVLDLVEDADTGEISHPTWNVRDPRGGESGNLSCLVDYPGESQRITIEWVTGWKVELLVHTQSLSDELGPMGGLVATFERPTA